MKINDLSLSAILAGFVAVIVGFASSVAIVLQAASAAGANDAIVASWLLALGIGMAISCIGLSWYYKAPIITAWSTPGAAFLATSLQGLSINQAIGAFMFAAVLGLIIGLSGWFDKLSRLLPLPLASAMLAGILLQFGLNVFTALQQQLALVGAMLLSYLIAKRFNPRYTILWVLIIGIAMTMLQGNTTFTTVHFNLAKPLFIQPEWSLSALLGVGLPLMVVTMASQNIPGIAVLRTSGFNTAASPLISCTSFLTLILAPFGAFALNLAAITAAICTGEEADPDPAKRYIAGIAAGLFYLLAGLFSATIVALFAAFPAEFITALAGLALFSTIAVNLASATADKDYREAAIVTLLVTASGMNLFNISSAFWGLIAGGLTILFMNTTRVIPKC
ncbi:benzoate/H(+) symporter BenE family transporter [Rheinheimera sp. MMS21-TC3]|uniref:benzoate/H(+) symporter BenE family transporter n=1 Tax=Rheinheimera sp. MMS21-TC3 TaxID=3072790 RepID=UPI0028C407F8|nr:benzoate/H(+) symporter BenE family transporter [Rheinheimera sp. MMS21-TC3]WNO61948.1 benzoate/H(+) symporter BenE family transporter [Rheinheimera sp. MMS21-TC3]